MLDRHPPQEAVGHAERDAVRKAVAVLFAGRDADEDGLRDVHRQNSEDDPGEPDEGQSAAEDPQAQDEDIVELFGLCDQSVDFFHKTSPFRAPMRKIFANLL